MRLSKITQVAHIVLIVLTSCQNINIDDDRLSAPANFSVSAVMESVNLEWSYVEGAESYTVYWKRDSTTVTVDDFSGKLETILVNSAVIGSLDGDVQYAFIVVAYGAGGMASPPSAVMLATPVPLPPLPVTAYVTAHPTSSATLLRVVFSEPVGTGMVSAILTDINSVAWFNANLDGSAYVGDSMGEFGFESSDPSFTFTGIEPDPADASTDGYTTTWDLSRPATVGTGVGIRLRFDRVSSDQYRLRRLSGDYVESILAGLFVP